MKFQDRKKKLVRVLKAAPSENPEELADFIMENGFDYTIYVAAKASSETVQKHKEKLKVRFD